MESSIVCETAQLLKKGTQGRRGEYIQGKEMWYLVKQDPFCKNLPQTERTTAAILIGLWQKNSVDYHNALYVFCL